MKTQNFLLSVLFGCLIIILLTGCAPTIVTFNYEVNQQLVSEKKVNSKAAIFFSIVDARQRTDIIGYMDNAFGGKVKKVKNSELDITKSIYFKYKEELSKRGFVFTDISDNSDLKLTFSITTFLAEMRPGMVMVSSKADCCMKVLLVTKKENIELYKTDVCGKGEQKTPIQATIQDIPGALSNAVDDVLNKILGETELINSINKFNK